MESFIEKKIYMKNDKCDELLLQAISCGDDVVLIQSTRSATRIYKSMQWFEKEMIKMIV